MFLDDNVTLKGWMAERDDYAFWQLVQRKSGAVFGDCLRVLGNAADAEDHSTAASHADLPRHIKAFLANQTEPEK